MWGSLVGLSTPAPRRTATTTPTTFPSAGPITRSTQKTVQKRVTPPRTSSSMPSAFGVTSIFMCRCAIPRGTQEDGSQVRLATPSRTTPNRHRVGAESLSPSPTTHIKPPSPRLRSDKTDECSTSGPMDIWPNWNPDDGTDDLDDEDPRLNTTCVPVEWITQVSISPKLTSERTETAE